jgi:hypothetical protein
MRGNHHIEVTMRPDNQSNNPLQPTDTGGKLMKMWGMAVCCP